jgi:hypothetical protein
LLSMGFELIVKRQATVTLDGGLAQIYNKF